MPEDANRSKDATEPQKMHIWPGMVMMAQCKSAAGFSTTIKNGLRYKLPTISNDNFEFVCVSDGGEEKGNSFVMSLEEVAAKMCLTHAITYLSLQARTIYRNLRLMDTSSPKFTIKHLIMGLGRAPKGCDVQVV